MSFCLRLVIKKFNADGSYCTCKECVKYYPNPIHGSNHNLVVVAKPGDRSGIFEPLSLSRACFTSKLPMRQFTASIA